MRIPKSFITSVKHVAPAGRVVLATLLLAGFILAIFAVNTHNVQAYDLTKTKNKGFEKDSNGDGIPNAWSKLFAPASDKRVCNQSYAGSCSYKMVGDGSDNWLHQTTLYSSGPAGIQATISAYTKGNSIGGGARVWVTFNHSDGSQNSVYFSLPAGSSPWTYRQNTGTADESFDSMSIWLESYGSGKMWVDNVGLWAVAP